MPDLDIAPRRHVRIGIDLGTLVDHTAIGVVEIVDTQELEEEHIVRLTRQPDQRRYTMRYLRRLPLNTAYPDIAVRIADIVVALRRTAPDATPHLYVDATGVGWPVAQIVVDELKRRHVRSHFTFCTLATGDGWADGIRKDTGGTRRTLRIGKGWLVSNLQALLQTRRLDLAGDNEANVEVDAFQAELRDFHVTTRPRSDQYGAVSGKHDDLVIAAALAVAERPPRQAQEDMADINRRLGLIPMTAAAWAD